MSMCDNPLNCYACANKGAAKRIRKSYNYVGVASAATPLPHADHIPVPKASSPDIVSSMTAPSFAPAYGLSDDTSYNPESSVSNEPILVNQNMLDSIVAKLELTQHKSEELASFMKSNNLLAPGVKVTAYRSRQATLQTLFLVNDEKTSAYCPDVGKLMDAMEIKYEADDWRLFIDSSKLSLKAVLLHKTNKKPSLPIAYSTETKETYDALENILKMVNYSKHMWRICCDLKVVAMLCDLQSGYIKYMCFLCDWDTRFSGDQYACHGWKLREHSRLQTANIIGEPLVPKEKILLPPLHIKLGIVKNFIKTVAKRDEVFECLKLIYPRLSESKIKEGIPQNLLTSNKSLSVMALFFGQLHREDKDDNLKEFLSHLFLECMIRYKNESWYQNQTLGTTDYPTAIPRYVEDAILNEGSIDLQNINVNEAERNELYATISAITLAPNSITSYNESDTKSTTEATIYTGTTTANYSHLDTNATLLPNSSTKPNAVYTTAKPPLHCPLRFDGYLCWPRTPAGTVLSQYCPEFVEGFNSKFLAHKTCLDNGSWYHHPDSGQEWSNYTNCIDYEDLEFRTFVNELYVKGYAVSCVALILSLMIFLGFKSLRCTRIRIHVHLFASLAFTCITWILWYKMIIEQPEIIRHNPYWCIGLHLVIHYFMLVNYFWMFCEGLHLHLVLVVVFVKDTIVMRWFKIFSWLSPFIFLAAYGLARYFHPEDNAHCWMNDSLLLWIFSVPVCISLVSSFFFLINVLRVIVRKLHPQSAQPAPLAIKKAVRATIILVPLFGLQHFLLPYRPDSGSPLERFYQLLSVILVSLQGFVVSFLFCFANHDVTFAVRSLLNRMMPGIVSPPPPGSNTGQLATTTPSKELGV